VRRVLTWVVGGVLLLVVLLMAYQALRAGLALRQAKVDASGLKAELAQGDEPSARKTIASLKANGRVARSNTDNLLWDLAARVPVLGDSAQALQVTSRVLDQTARSAAPAALEITSTLSSGGLRSADGTIDLHKLDSLRPAFQTLASASSKASTDLGTVRTTGLLPTLRGTFGAAQTKVDAMGRTAATGLTTLRLLPGMLGADGPRTYLVAVQNNAEVRATGGLPGAFLILTAQDGKVRITGQPPTTSLPILPSPILPLTPGELTLFGPTMGEDVRDTNLTPDFPRAASLMRAMVERRYHLKLDGVIGVDPVALSGILGVTGPIKVGGDSFDQRNAVGLLLSQVYRRYPTNAEQNAYFSRAASSIFNGLLGAKLNQLAITRQLSDAGAQRRLLMWSAHPDEQKQLQGTAVSGALPTPAGGVPHVGLFLNDATAGKMDYYLDYDTAISSLSCTRQGVQTLRTGMVLDSTAPKDVSALPAYVTGDGKYTPKGDIRTNLRIYAPQGGDITRLEANGHRVPVRVRQVDGLPVSIVGLVLQPGEQIRLVVTLKSGEGQRSDPVLQVTPGVRTTTSSSTSPSSCR
jgi:hypothetical protein